ncbi:FecR family protein [Mucilaginibacter sp. PAMB04274]|uniref:FecR family protein n=1 Tax=Mucilaginibacter sp. PAMB04274 TaxID=3138568 RepID=UPI0031F6D4B2
MTPYEHYEVEDFMQDEFFIEWVLHPSENSNAFWSGWLMHNPDRQPVLERARAIVSSITVKPVARELADTEVRSIIDHVRLNGFKTEQPVPTIKISRTGWFQAAAVILICFTAALLIYRQVNVKHVLSQTNNEYIQVSNQSNQSKLVRMNDGSLAVLHPASVLRYPSRFNGSSRNVYLSGEAFFEVHKNPRKPFLVHSQNMITRVLGTSFTVRAFKNENAFKVIVNTGKVMVYADKQQAHKINAKSVMLLPNQEVTFDHNQIVLKKDTLQTPLLLSKEVATHKFTFNNAPLSQIIARLNEAYAIHIVYDQERLGNQTLTASLSDLPLDEKVKLICKAINAQCSFDGGQIKILNP